MDLWHKMHIEEKLNKLPSWFKTLAIKLCNMGCSIECRDTCMFARIKTKYGGEILVITITLDDPTHHKAEWHYSPEDTNIRHVLWGQMYLNLRSKIDFKMLKPLVRHVALEVHKYQEDHLPKAFQHTPDIYP